MFGNRVFFNLCYINGSADGIVQCQFGQSNPDYVAYRIHSVQFEKLRLDKERRKDPMMMPLENSGVYILLYRDTDGKVDRAYVGQAGARGNKKLGVLNRIHEHQTDGREGWSEAILLTKQATQWEPTELCYLENKFFLSLSKIFGEEHCTNDHPPRGANPSGPTQYQLNILLDHLAFRAMSLMGVKFPRQKPNVRRSAQTTQMCGAQIGRTQTICAVPTERVFECRSKKASAHGFFSRKRFKDGFTVLRGSKFSMFPVESFKNDSAFKVWRKLIEDGLLTAEGLLSEDYEFSSPSCAAAVVKARSANGKKEWLSEGKPLKEFEGLEKQLCAKQEKQQNCQCSQFKNPTQLGKAIAVKYNDGHSVDYAIGLVSGRDSVKRGKWRDILTKVGVEFDETGHVVDWSKAKV